MSSKLFPWVEDGIYDYLAHNVRHRIKNGNPTHSLTKMWVDQGVPEHLISELKQPWGSFPDLPPKPKS